MRPPARPRDGAVVLRIPDPRLVAATTRRCRESVARTIDAWDGAIVLDLTEVTGADAGGLALLAFAARRAPGRLHVASPNRLLRTLLEVTRLDAALALHAGVDAALAALDVRTAALREAA
jgi:ABC-type transporter Mla MlaB component